jgi:hypothetical protein
MRMAMDAVPSIPDAAFSSGIFVYGRSFLGVAQALAVPVDSVVAELARKHETSAFVFDTGILQLEGKAAFVDFERNIGHAVRQHGFDLAVAAGPLNDRIRLGGAVLDGRSFVPGGKRFFFHAWGKAFERPDAEAVQLRVLDDQTPMASARECQSLVLEYLHDVPLPHCLTVANSISQCIEAAQQQAGIGHLRWQQDVALAYKKAFQFALRFETANVKTSVSLLVSTLLDLHAEDLPLKSVKFVFSSGQMDQLNRALKKRHNCAYEVRIA